MSGIATVSGDCYDRGSIEKTWLYIYDGDGVKAKQEYRDGSIVQTTYYYAGDAYEVVSDGTGESVHQYYTLSDSVIAMSADSTFNYFLTDHLGSVEGVTDANGALLSETRYMASRTLRPRAKGERGKERFAPTWARSLRPTTASPSKGW